MSHTAIDIDTCRCAHEAGLPGRSWIRPTITVHSGCDACAQRHGLPLTQAHNSLNFALAGVRERVSASKITPQDSPVSTPYVRKVAHCPVNCFSRHSVLPIVSATIE